MSKAALEEHIEKVKAGGLLVLLDGDSVVVASCRDGDVRKVSLVPREHRITLGHSVVQMLDDVTKEGSSG